MWENGDLRYIKMGGVEVVRRIYVAIRDRNWGTAPNTMSNLVMDVGEDAFRITYDVENRLNEIYFTWHGEITGAADGTIDLSMDGMAQSTFMKNRIGYCILHPDDIAGAWARVQHVDGAAEDALLPHLFDPNQPVLPFAEMTGLAHEVMPGVCSPPSRRGYLRDGGSAQLKLNQRVDVTGVTKGRGFAGVFKRWGMKGAARDSSTAHEHHRHPGAIGQRKTPGKVWKGKHLPGHYGVDVQTVQNLFVEGIEPDRNLLLVTGAVPGHADGLLFVGTAAKGQPRAKQKQVVRERSKPKV